MRWLYLVLISGIASACACGQAPEKIYGKNKRLMPNTYYVEQMGLWRAETQKEPRNADAWYNYYRASRNAYVVGDEQETKDTRGTGRFARLQGIVDSMAVLVPGSFEYQHVRWMNGYGDASLLPYLLRAHAMFPQRPEPYMDLVTYYELAGADSLRVATSKAYLALKDYSPGLLHYGRNLLAGLAPDALLLTHGDKDTEAVWLLQDGQGLRTDIHLLNLDMLLRKEYREREFERAGIAPLPKDPLSSDAAFAWFQQNIIAHISANTRHRPVEVSLSVEGPWAASIGGALYLTGLSYRYTDTVFDAVPDLIANYEHRYQLEPLYTPFTPDLSEGNVRQFNGHYLPSLFALCDHYSKLGEEGKVKEYKALAERITADAGR